MPRCPTCGERNARNFYRDKSRDKYQTYCKECSKERRRQWALKNPKAIAKYAEKSYQALRKDSARWREHLKNQSEQRTKQLLAAQVYQNNHRAKKAKVQGKLGVKEWYQLILPSTHCPGCKRPWVLLGRPTIDHIRPLKLRGSNTLDNIQPLCHSCNVRKKARIQKFIERQREQ